MAERSAEKVVAYKAILVGYSILVLGLALVVVPSVVGLPAGAKDLLQIMGVALLPTGLISLVNEYFLRKDIVAQMASLFDDFLLGHIDELFRANKSLATVHEANPTSDVCAAFENATREIWLMNGWIPDFEGLQKGFRSAISRQVKIRILLLDPDHELTEIRAREIGLPKPESQHYYTSIDLDNIVRFIEDAGGETFVEIRLFRELMIAPLYATENSLYVGWFYKARRAVAGPVVRVDGDDNPLARAMRDSFERVWSARTTEAFYPPREPMEQP